MWFTAFFPVIKWGLIALTTYFTAKKGIEAFGSTPANRAEQQLGIPKERLPEHRQKYLDNRKEYLNERQENHKKELDELYKKVEKLEEEKTQVAAQVQETENPQEKAKLQAQLASLENQLKEVKSQIGKKEKQLANDEKAIDDLFKEIGNDTSLNPEQVQGRANNPDLKSWLNWGIIFIVMIVAIMITKMVVGLLKNINKGTKE